MSKYLEATGRMDGPGDAFAQTTRCFEIIQAAPRKDDHGDPPLRDPRQAG
ncbi:hypothetical protein [Pseudooceanicola sp. HF7]|nr:hypothetical protein [Pseudooceanicola sp. HF7]